MASYRSGLPQGYWENSRRVYDPAGSGDLRGLIVRLREFDVEPSRVKNYEAIAAVTSAPPSFPDRVLDRSPAEVLEIAETIGIWHTATNNMIQQLFLIQQQAFAELRDSMVAEADDYILALRPVFDQAAEQVRECRALGINEADEPEQIMRRGGDAVAAWLQLRDVSANTLDAVAGARITMSTTLGLPPVHGRHESTGRPLDYGRCFTLPEVAFESAGRTIGRVPESWRRWLHLAPHLHLTTLDELGSTRSAATPEEADDAA